MKTYLSILLLLSLSLSIGAQTPSSPRGIITGAVYEKSNKTKEPVMQATVRVLSAKDSSLVTGAVSDLDGRFEIKQLKWGSYIVQVSYVGFSSYFQNVALSSRQPSIHLGEVTLESGSVNLGEIVVSGKAPEVIVKPDTVDFNPNAYTSKENDVVEDLLKKLPGVEVSEDGTITYAGKQISKILIDGKQFFGDDPLVASKNLPVDIIERLQVIDDKSDAAKRTGVDDGEKEKVINISVKKDKKKGWFGDIGAGYGTKDRYAGKAMVNRFIGDDKYTFILNTNNTNNMGFGDRSGQMRGGGGYGGGIITSHSLGSNIIKEFGKKVKTVGTLNLSASSSDAQRKSNRQNILQDSSYYTNSANKRIADAQNINFNYRIEYNPDTMNFFIFTPSFNYGHNKVNSIDSTETLDGRRIPVNRGVANSSNNANNLSGSLRAEYVHRFKKQGRSFGATLTGSLSTNEGTGYNKSTNTFYNTESGDSISLLDQRILNHGNSQSVSGRFFYTEPIFGPRNYLQFRYNFNLNRRISEKDTYRRDSIGDDYTILDPRYTRGNRNDFFSQSFGITYRVVRDKYRYALGVRAEPSSTKSVSYVRDSILSDLPQRNVVNISPNAMFRYRFSNTCDLNAEYRGRMDQPSAAQLLPVADVSNPLNIVTGNPDLLPSFTHDGNIEYNKSVPEKQTTISTEIGWSLTSNNIVNYSVLDRNTGVKNTTYKNVDGTWNAYGRFMASFPFKNKRWQFNTYTFMRYGKNIGFTNGNRNISTTTFVSESLILRYRIDKVMEAGIRGNGRYSGAQNSLQSSNNQQTFDYSGSFFGTGFLPWDLTLGTELRYNGNTGYASGYSKEEWIWNADISKAFLKKKNAILSIKAYDILGQMKNINRSVTGNYIEDSQFNTLTSYALLTFTYKFNTFGGKMPDGGGNSPRRGPHRR